MRHCARCFVTTCVWSFRVPTNWVSKLILRQNHNLPHKSDRLWDYEAKPVTSALPQKGLNRTVCLKNQVDRSSALAVNRTLREREKFSARKGGLARAARMTPEERSESARQA